MVDIDDQLVEGIKRAMAEGKVSMKRLSARTGLPYRTLQNYLLGTARMPASAYVMICRELGIDNQYVLQGNFHLQFAPLWDALWDVFGDFLSALRHEPNTSGVDNMELHNRKQAAASKFAAAISDAYNAVRLSELQNGHSPHATIETLRAKRVRRHGIDGSGNDPQR